MNTTKVTNGFISAHARPATERKWLRTTFTLILRVAKRSPEFSMDDIWQELDKAYDRGSLPDIDMDHRVLGPMLLHLVREGLISSSGYYVKSARPGGGSRPITIWTSNVYTRGRVAA